MFIHLHCHSHYSFLRGVASPEEIIAAAVEQKMPAVALTDTNGMYAAVGFYQAARKAGVKPIVGVVLDVDVEDGRREIPPLRANPSTSLKTSKNHRPSGRDDKPRQMATLVLLAADMEGYSNLCELVTLRHLGTTELACPGRQGQSADSDEEEGRPVTLEELAEHSKGVIALAPMPNVQMRSCGATASRRRMTTKEETAAMAVTASRTGTACRAPTRESQSDAGWREQELHGASQSDAGRREQELHGTSQTDAEREQELHGTSQTDAEREQELHGTSQTDAEREQELHGTSQSDAGRKQELHGTSQTDEGREQELHGASQTDAGRREQELHGTGQTDAGWREQELHGTSQSDAGWRKQELHGASQSDAGRREQELHGTSHESPFANAQGKPVTSYFARLKEIFGDPDKAGAGRLYIEVQHLSPGDGRVLREAERIGRELGVPLVATNNVHFLRPEEHLHHRTMNAIRTGGLLTTVTAPEITSGEAWFKPAAEMQRVFPDHPELLRATLEIAERCNLQLELGKPIFPEFPVPKGESPFSYLWKLSFEGAQKLYRPLRPPVLSRLTHELEVIEKLNLAPYFLLVWDIVEEARRRGIPAVARGSAASSMVTYCLGISRVCPLRWGLYFERFLNMQRGDCPDIDIDICGARRDELLDYVYKRWGQEHVAGGRQGPYVVEDREGPHVAMIGSFITMHARLAVREVAKVFGVPPGEVNRFTKRLPHGPVREILTAIRELPECRSLPVDDEPWKTILEVALRFDDAPRHLGIHPCGTVISARPLTRLTPLERATKGIVVTQYDMNAIEALGLIKMDLLGQRGFTTMSLALDNIEKGAKEINEIKETEEKSSIAPDGTTPCPKPRVIDFDAIPENDPATCEVMAQGRTIGVFQIESPGMRGLLRAMKARTLEEIAAALALIRPGASEFGSKELFLKRLRKQEPVVYAHESLQNILGDTLGVCIYQEQVMQIAQAVGSMSLQEADLVRRSSVKYSGQRDRDRLRGKFLQAAGIMGLTTRQREETWMMVEKFAGFGFCKAHAATYADISYRMAYLKTHHTAEFLAAMCSAGAGFYHVSAYVEEAKRWGIAVRLPSVNRSRMEYTAETAADEGRALRVGLMQVKGLRLETILSILRSREESGVFRSLEDFLRRVPRWNRGKPVERDEIEALIKCGAFDEVGDDTGRKTRPEMLWRWNFLQAGGKSALPGSAMPLEETNTLFAKTRTEDAVSMMLEGMPAAEYTQEQKLRYEREILEVCVSGHPLDFLPRNGEAWSDELAGMVGKRVTLCGWVVTYRHVGTKNYRNMMFVTLEDQRGVYEAVLFPEAYERHGGLIYETRTLRVTGRVEQDGQVNCDGLAALKK